ncbi:MAG: hypothetical protein Q9195_005324 [Heterodermia aff. obscurata]
MDKGGLDLQDLPFLKARMTAYALVLKIKRSKSSCLWRQVVRAHPSAFATQWILTVFWAFATLAPQYCLYQLIKTLEKDAQHPDPSASLWLILLGLSQLIQPWTEAWLLWIGWCHIALPIYVQLSGLIVEKTMRKKDIKGFGANNDVPEASDRQKSDENWDTKTEIEGDSQETRNLGFKRTQDVINLITVDAQRLTDFLSYNSHRLEATLSLVPGLVTDFVNAWISFDRLERFLSSPERFDRTIDNDIIAFEGASIDWPSDEESLRQAKLCGLNFTFPKNSLSIIAGPTGAGKSLLLSAIVGEADVLNGTIRRPKPNSAIVGQINGSDSNDWIIPKTMALVAQTPWIENATIRDNILFNLPLVESRYSHVLQACALLQDLRTMDDGDMTEVGAHGVSLSGGQRSRLSLARALYSRAEILVMDDIFSAVDTHVGRHILDHALTSAVAEGRTCILATHNLQLCLPKSNFIVMLSEGAVEYAGSPKDSPQSSAWIPAEEENRADSNQSLSSTPTRSPLVETDLRRGKNASNASDDSQSESTALSEISAQGSSSALLEDMKIYKPNRTPRKLVQEEGRETGRVNRSVYKAYVGAASSWPWVYWLVVIGLFIGFEAALIGRNLWVKFWTDQSGNPGTELRPNVLTQGDMSKSGLSGLLTITASPVKQLSPITPTHPHNTYYVTGCVVISLIASFLGTLKFFWVYLGSLRASRHLFTSMTQAVLHTPLRWLDMVPTGRILNRFTADFDTVDSTLATGLVLFVYSCLQLAGIVVAGAFVSPWLFALFMPLLIVCGLYARIYLAGARDVKRLQSVMKSPVLDQVDSILSGLATIRAWDQCRSYTERMYSKIDDHARCVWHLWLFNRWLGIRFAAIGAVFTVIIAAFSVYSPVVSASLAGLALNFSLDFTQAVFWVLRRYANVEMDMNSLERIVEYCAVPKEKSGGSCPPAHWPSNGRIDVSDLAVSYATDSPLVLQGVSFTCEPGSRVGFVGRTGAGKSSLTLALFRFLEARAGSIVIDGLDISTLALEKLRKRMAIIPQHPILWLGTIRDNLDPFDEYDDWQLQEVLERVRLSQQTLSPDASSIVGETRPGACFRLSTAIAEGGTNISLGQRQLVCLARVLLTRPKILIMDEATSAVDAETDKMVQESIRREFRDSTLLVIAHKLSTVIDFDQIVMLEEGRVIESGVPKNLWEKGGAFAQMVKQGREVDLLEKLK